MLKDKGLERIDGVKEDQKVEEQKEQASEKQAQLSVSSKRTNFMRVPSKPISQTVENLHYQIDVKQTSVRPVQGNISKLKDQHQQNDQQQD